MVLEVLPVTVISAKASAGIMMGAPTGGQNELDRHNAPMDGRGTSENARTRRIPPRKSGSS